MKCKTKGCGNVALPENDFCGACEDALIELANKRREWDHFHPGEPMPESERKI